MGVRFLLLGLSILVFALVLASCTPPLPASRCEDQSDCPRGYTCRLSLSVCTLADAGRTDASTSDVDARHPDAHSPDHSAADASSPDVSSPDVRLPDANLPDASSPDVTWPDANLPDTNLPDMSLPDTSLPDMSLPDTSLPDIGFDACTPATVRDPTDRAGAWFGAALAAAGDVDGDGYDDALVGARGWPADGPPNDGRVYLYYGSGAPTDARAPAVIDPPAPGGELFGWSVSGAGDINADGYDDIMIGGKYWGTFHEREGRLYVYYGSESGISTSDFTFFDPTDQELTAFTEAVAAAGDVNGDGYDDVIASSPWVGQGVVYLYLGGEGGLGPTPQQLTVAADGTAAPRFGWALDGAGDVDGDGYDDVVIGAPLSSDGVTLNQGRVYLYRGSESGLDLAPRWQAALDDNMAYQYGRAVAGVGDLNGDGFADVMIGCPFCGDVFHDSGKVDLYYGSADGLSLEPVELRPPDDLIAAQFGARISGMGDVNNDGFGDVVISAEAAGYAADGDPIGRAMVYLGSALGLETPPYWSSQVAWYDSVPVGTGLSLEADVNGDGYSDLMVGSAKWDGPDTADEGRASLLLGPQLCH